MAEVSTDRGVPLQCWHVVATGVAVWTLFVATLDLSGSKPAGVDGGGDERGRDDGEPATDAEAPPTDESPGPGRPDDGTGFEWGDGSRG